MRGSTSRERIGAGGRIDAGGWNDEGGPEESFNTSPAVDAGVQLTRRFWEALGVAVALGLAAVLADRPLLLVPAGVVLAWLLGMQVGFVHALDRFDDGLTVEQTLEQPVTVVDSPTTLTVRTAGGAADGALDVAVQVRSAPGLVVDDPAVAFGETVAVTVASPVAGRHRVHPPLLRVVDPAGLFVEHLERGPAATLRVEAPSLERLHVGEGGSPRLAAHGQHPGERFGSGLVPAEIREYQPEEPVSMVDWKATARLGEPYVRRYESETDLTTTLVVDARTDLAVGPPGQTALDYLRAAALRYLAGAVDRGDPVGCLAVADDGVRRLVETTTTATGYDRTREAILDATADPGGGPEGDVPGEGRRARAPPLGARAGDVRTDTRFGRTLAAFAGVRPAATDSPDPLADAVRTAVAGHTGRNQVAIFTDDADRAAVRRAVADARPGRNDVAVFLAPRVLYEPGALGDRERALEAYRGFERFRRDLAGIEGVRAYEVAPRDRLEAVRQAGAVAGG